MNGPITLGRAASLGAAFAVAMSSQLHAGGTPLGTEFTYQGRLNLNGSAVNNSADFQFRLWDSATVGGPVSPIQQPTNVALTDGLFTVEINFLNNVWDGSERWLEIAARVPHDPSNTLPFTTLTPRQQVTATPYALQTRGIFVSAGGSICLGTVTPLSQLTVSGDLSFVDDSDTIRFPATTVANEPMIEMFASGTANNDRMVIAHSADFSNYGLQYQDVGDRFHFLSNGVRMMTVDLGSRDVGIGTEDPAFALDVVGRGRFQSDGTATAGFWLRDVANTADKSLIGRLTDVEAATGIWDGNSWAFQVDDLTGSVFIEGNLTVDNPFTVTSSANISGSLDVGSQITASHGIIDNFLIIGDNSCATGALCVDATDTAVANLDRINSDGVIMFLSQNGSSEGTISVAGNTVSYNAFTGSHYAWIDDASSIDRGALVRMTGDNWRLRDEPASEIVYGVEVATRANDPACLGAYLGLQESKRPASADNPHLVMAVGNGEIWVTPNAQGDIQPGDYLMSSSVPGCAMEDDPRTFPVGYIVARAAEAVDWSTVEPGAAGIRRARISVLFESFVRDNGDANRLAQRVAELETEVHSLRDTAQLRAENQSLRARLEALEALVEQFANQPRQATGGAE